MADGSKYLHFAYLQDGLSQAPDPAVALIEKLLAAQGSIHGRADDSYGNIQMCFDSLVGVWVIALKNLPAHSPNDLVDKIMPQAFWSNIK